MKCLEKRLSGRRNFKIVRDAVYAWDPLGLVPVGMEKRYRAEISDIAACLDDSMNASEIAELIAHTFSLHCYPFVFQTKLCLRPALQIKYGQTQRATKRTVSAVAGIVGMSAVATVAAVKYLGGRNNV